MLERWTRGVVRWRIPVLVAWIAIAVVGIGAAGRLQPLLATSFAVPGTESERARQILADAYGERPDGTFTVVLPTERIRDKALRRAFHARLVRATAASVPGGRVGTVRDGTGVLYATIGTARPLQDAKAFTGPLRRALAAQPGGTVLVTGQPAFQTDLEPVVRRDLRRGQAIALGVALVVLLLVLGPSLAVLVPFAFAACSISLTLAVLELVAHRVTMATYVTNLVELIGLGLAIDYSLLVVLRFREEIARGGPTDDAVVRTVASAGRTAVFSGTAVAVGLGLLLLVPVPFIRSMGIGGLLVPLASIAALLTLQPALLSLLGPRGARRLGRQPDDVRRATGSATWARIAYAVLRRPLPVLVVGVAALALAAVPLLRIHLTPGTLKGAPAHLESWRGYELLRHGIGPGVVTPTSVVVDTGRPGGAQRADVQAAIDRLGDRLFEDFSLAVIGSGTKAPYVDPSGRYTRLIAAGRAEYGAPVTRSFVRRLRARDIPAARFPADVTVVSGGAPPQGVDFLDRAYDALPWLVLAALLVTYVVLLRAFRSLLIPLKAVLLNTLTVAATLGLMVLLFQDGVGSGLLGLRQGEIEGWVPIFLFGVLFGLSMDYEVFIVSRMRETWDAIADNAVAVATGLERTGRVVSAAAVIMVGAFAGFVTGSVAGLEQLGVGLSIAVLLDATIVRALLVPAAMGVLGRWNWWLPDGVARVALVEPSPIGPGKTTGARHR